MTPMACFSCTTVSAVRTGARTGSPGAAVRRMRLLRGVGVAAVLLCAAPVLRAAPPAATAHRPPTAAEVLAGSAAADWRALDPQNTLYLELATGRVVIELAPEFAPNYVANVLALSLGKYFDGLPIERSQDNYVVQWGDRAGKKPVGTAHGMVGSGRGDDVDSGGGTELYVVIGQAPRHLDRNVTLLGRVVSGMELLSV